MFLDLLECGVGDVWWKIVEGKLGLFGDFVLFGWFVVYGFYCGIKYDVVVLEKVMIGEDVDKL